MILPQSTAPPIHCTPLCRVSSTTSSSKTNRRTHTNKASGEFLMDLGIAPLWNQEFDWVEALNFKILRFWVADCWLTLWSIGCRKVTNRWPKAVWWCSYPFLSLPSRFDLADVHMSACPENNNIQVLSSWTGRSRRGLWRWRTLGAAANLRAKKGRRRSVTDGIGTPDPNPRNLVNWRF